MTERKFQNMPKHMLQCLCKVQMIDSQLGLPRDKPEIKKTPKKKRMTIRNMTIKQNASDRQRSDY